MFSGLIRYQGLVILSAVEGRQDDKASGIQLAIRCDGVQSEQPQPGDSIAIDGVCLTATAIDGEAVAFDVVPETLACSTLGDRVAGDVVNVEYALRVGDRLGGHFVYGHVDAAPRVLSRTPEGQGERMRVESPPGLAAMIVPKAFIAIDGISLTVAATGDGWFEIALIPETIARTTLRARPPGTRVNLEVDPIARYALHASVSC
ncbi:MAG TPA: riboflavin synthase [Candidatus Cybelea sp.]|nr:riboflavin synthase [Candidatus Cybelea sp.]